MFFSISEFGLTLFLVFKNAEEFDLENIFLGMNSISSTASQPREAKQN